MAINERKQNRKFNSERAIREEEKFYMQPQSMQQSKESEPFYVVHPDVARKQISSVIPQQYHEEFLEKLVQAVSTGKDNEVNEMLNIINNREMFKNAVPTKANVEVVTPQQPDPYLIESKYGRLSYDDLLRKIHEEIGQDNEQRAIEIATLYSIGEIDHANSILAEIAQEKVIESTVEVSNEEPKEHKMEAVKEEVAVVKEVKEESVIQKKISANKIALAESFPNTSKFDDVCKRFGKRNFFESILEKVTDLIPA